MEDLRLAAAGGVSKRSPDTFRSIPPSPNKPDPLRDPCVDPGLPAFSGAASASELGDPVSAIVSLVRMDFRGPGIIYHSFRGANIRAIS